MSIRTTITLDDDVSIRLKRESAERGIPFKTFLNNVIRTGFLAMESKPPSKPFRIEPVDMGWRPGLNYDNISELIANAEGEDWR